MLELIISSPIMQQQQQQEQEQLGIVPHQDLPPHTPHTNSIHVCTIHFLSCVHLLQIVSFYLNFKVQMLL